MTPGDFRKRFLLTILSFFAAMAITLFAFLKGYLPPRFLAWALIALIAVLFAAFLHLFRKERPEQQLKDGR
ncbi:MAG: hypothetical protein WA476_21300 [Acidobacteriaceae bacterium]